MSQPNKLAQRPHHPWQRHALSIACGLTIAGLSVTAGAAPVVVLPGAALSMVYGSLSTPEQTLGDDWWASYNSPWANQQISAGSLMAPITNATYFSSSTGAGSYPVSVMGNTIMASVFANQASSTQTALNRTAVTDDGILSLNLQIFTGLVDTSGASATFSTPASAMALLDNTSKTDGSVYIKQQSMDSANLALSNNTLGASANLNSLNTAVTVATPAGYVSSSKGSSALTFDSTGDAMGTPGTPSAGTSGSVNLSSLQGVFNATGVTEVTSATAKVTVTESATALADAINVNGNSITGSTTSNAAVSIFRSTSGSSAFTGTVGVSNLQSTTIDATVTAAQLAKVSGSGVAVNLRDGASGQTDVTGAVTISDNTVTAVALGNTAGSQLSTGSVSAGNAIIFEGSSNITGANTVRTTDLTASLTATQSSAKADLLINSVQRNTSNSFTATLDTPTVVANLDNLDGGSLTQSGNSLISSAVNNLAGNLISVGQSVSMGAMTGSVVMLNTQNNLTGITLAEVTDASVAATIGTTGVAVSGSSALNSNTISAKAQANLAVSSLALKADNLSVGLNNSTVSNGVTLTPSTSVATSGLAVSMLNAQANDAMSLSAFNTGGSVALTFADASASAVDISGTQASVNSNQLTATATANSASNRATLQSTNATGMNIALGSTQSNVDSDITASAGSSSTALSLGLQAQGSVNGSQLSLNSNSITAQAQLNTVTNSLSTTLTNTSGVAGMLTGSSAPMASVGDLTSGAVAAKADFALANAQVNNTSTAESSSYGTMAITAGAVGSTDASTVQANSNSIAALVDGNLASNAITLTQSTMTGMTAALASGQLSTETSATSTVAGDVSVSAATVGSASTVSVNLNEVRAVSTGNGVNNALTVSASTASGRAVNTLSASPTQTQITSSSAQAKADFALSSSQVLSKTSALNDVVSATSGAVKASTTGNTGGASTITVDANTLSATSTGNSAGNAVSVSVSTLTQADVALASRQSATEASVTATNTSTDSGIEVGGNVTGTSRLTVTNNQVKSTAVVNTATNQVTLSGTHVSAPALTQSSKGVDIDTNTTVVASMALANQQDSSSNAVTASLGTSNASSVMALSVNAVGDASALTLSGNSLAAQAYNNAATNGVSLNVTNATGMTVALASKQDLDAQGALSKAETFGSLKLQAGAVTGGSSLNANENNITSNSTGNYAANNMSVTASQWDGRLSANGQVSPLLAADSTSGAVTMGVAADVALANQQNITGTGKTTKVIEATVDGTVQNTFTSLAASSLNTNTNTVSSEATGSTAVNALVLNTTGLTGTTLGLGSTQVMDSAKVSSASTTGTTGVGATGSGTVSNASVAVNANTVKSSAVANAVNNALTLTGSNATGTGASVVPSLSFDLAAVTVTADATLVSNQRTDSSTVLASTGTSASAPAWVTLDSGAVSGTSTVALNSNVLASTAYANSATNAATATVSSLNGMTLALGQAQTTADSTLDASTFGKVSAQLASMSSANASVNSNAITSAAMANTAGNRLSVAGTNASGRGTAATFIQSGNTVTADMTLSSAQVFTANTVVASTDGDIQLVSAGAMGTASNASLNSNSISAYGSANYVTNELSLAANNTSDATSALVSTQSTSRTGTLDSVSATTTGSLLLQAAAVSSANLSMNSNTVKSTSLDNVAINLLTMSGSTATGTSGLTMTGVSSPLTTTSSSSVAADVSLVNLQTSAHQGDMTGYTGVQGDAVDVAIVVAGASSATVSANNNTLSSVVYANNASNALGLGVTTLSAMTAAVSNSQQVTSGALDATTLGGIRLTSTDDVSASSLTVKNNSITATAGANDVSNQLAVTSTNVVGRDMVSRVANAGALQVATDLALANEQQLASTTTVQSVATGDVHLDATGKAMSTSNAALTNNVLSAYGSGNNAVNQLGMSSSNISQASVGVASSQTMSAGSAVTSEATGSLKMTADLATDANLSITGNTIKSTALGNAVANTLAVTASTYTGPSDSTVTAVAGSGTTAVAADFALANEQSNVSGTDVKATTLGTVQMAVGDVTLSAGTSSNSLTGNTVKALAQSNSASNDMRLNVTQMSAATAGVASYQRSTAAVSASVGPDTNSSSGGVFAITAGDVSGGSITVSGNNASALAGMNEAFNTLTVTGANLLGKGTTVLAPSAGVVSNTGADFAVMNAQSASNSVEASVNAGSSGFSTLGTFSGGSLAVVDNTVLARASANIANNTLTLAAVNRLEASGVVNNLQEMANSTSVLASVSSASALGAELGSSSGNATVTVRDNSVTAQATGNVANNALNATATNAITAAGGTSTPTFAVLNSQSTGTAPTGVGSYGVQSIINGITIGGTQLGGALNGGSVSAAGNQLTSVAYGNSVNNAVVVSSLAPGLNTASASITNVQYNLTSVTATVNNATVQASGASAVNGGNINISGNSTIAMAVGNRSINSITGR
jgi:hypothetical protein